MRVRSFPDLDRQPDRGPSPEDWLMLARGELEQEDVVDLDVSQIEKYLAKLTLRQREVLMLVYADLTCVEIAEQLGIAESTAYIHYYKACKRLGIPR